MDVVKFIVNELENRGIKQKQFAAMIGMDDSSFSDFLKGKRLEIPFPSIKKAMKILCKENFPKMMQFICENTFKPDNMRMVLEYASISRDLPLLEKMIGLLSREGKKEKEWASVYEIALRFQSRDTSNKELMVMIDKVKPKSAEMKILRKILRARVLYRMKEYDTMFRNARDVEEELSGMKESYLTKTFTIRLNELFAQGYLYVNSDTEKARFYALNVINNETISAVFKSHAYHIVGTSFLFEDYDKAIENFEAYKSQLDKNRRDDIVRTVDEKDVFFAKVLWDRDLETLDTNDNLEKAHLEFKKGNVEKAIEILNEVEQSPFSMCYLGLATNNPLLILESFFKLIGQKQMFFANIPAMYLKKYPEYKKTVELALQNIKVA
jgi:transcriptional regulator with XRE-family HTH domain